MISKHILRLFPIFLFISAGQINAQTLEWSISEKVEGRIIYTEILGEINNSYYIVKYDKKSRQTFIIEKFTHDMKMVKQYEFRVDKEVNVEKIVIADRLIQVFYSYYDRHQKLYGLFVNTISADLEILSKDKFIGSTKFTMEKDVFVIRKDDFKNRLCILFPELITDHEIYYRILILDNQANILYSDRMATLQEENSKLEQIYSADSNVVLIFTNKISIDHSRQKKDILKALYYNISTKKTNLFNLYDDSIRFANLTFKYNPTIPAIYLSGFYNLAESERFYGLAVFTIFPLKDSSSLSVIGFTKELNLEINGRNNENGITDYYPRTIIFRNDGGLIFNAEYFNIERESYSSYYTMSSNYVKYYYQYGDMVIISVNPDGTTDWTKLIRKEQVTVGDEGYYSSFMIGVLDHKILLIFNEMNKNKWNLVCSSINPAGETNSQLLVNGGSFDGFLIPKIGRQVSDKVVLIPGFIRKKGFTLLKITF